MLKLAKSLACVLVMAWALVGCSTHAERMAPVWNAYRAHQFDRADALINEKLNDEFDLDESEAAVLAKHPLLLNLDTKDPEQALLLLEKAMIMLAKGDAKSAEALLRQGRAAYDHVYLKTTLKTMAENIGAALSDDRALDYDPAPYEHIMIRCCLVMANLLNGGQDVVAYSNQIDEAQQEIFDFQFEGGGKTFSPYERYKRVGFGAYMRGVNLEGSLNTSSALMAYRNFQAYEPNLPYAAQTVQRVEAGNYAPTGYGVVHVLYLGGAGPTLETVNHKPTQNALAIAGIIGSLATKTWSPAAQTLLARVPVPQVAIHSPYVPALSVSSGTTRVTTSLVLDINQLAIQHLESQMDYIVARAVVRRVLKATTSAIVEAGAKKAAGDAGQIAAIIGGLIWSAAEEADTRIWGTLPAQIQTARLPLEEGTHTLRFGDGNSTQVRVSAGHDSFVIVLRPNLSLPAKIAVDTQSVATPRPE